jgi:hypothetical protein
MPSSDSRRRNSKANGGILFDPLPSHADKEQRTSRKSREKESGAFDWTPGIAIALLGAMTLLDVQKSVEKKERRKQEEEEREKRRRGSSTGGNPRGRSQDYGSTSGGGGSSHRSSRRYDEDRYYHDDRYHNQDRHYDDRDDYDGTGRRGSRRYRDYDDGYSSRRDSW